LIFSSFVQAWSIQTGFFAVLRLASVEIWKIWSELELELEDDELEDDDRCRQVWWNDFIN
jgi:hypothetical protein